MAPATALRVVQVNKRYPPHIGGIETHVGQLAEGLAAWPGVDVQVLAAGMPWGTVREHYRRVSVTRVVSLGVVASLPLAPTLPWSLLRAARTADIVHLHEPFPLAAVGALALPPRVKLVVTWHSDVVRQRWALPAYAPIVRRLLERADAVILPSQAHLAGSHVLPAHQAKCTVIPFGVDVAAFAPTAARQAKAAAIRAALPGPVILFVGRLVYYKGVEHLIRALALLPPRVTLVIVGDGPLRRRLAALAANLGLAQRVRFTGWLDDETLRACYLAADLVVLPSVARSEGFGIVQLEAMASGRPVICTALPTGVPTVGIPGTTGLIVPPGDAAALAAAAGPLLANPSRRQAMGVAGWRHAVIHYDLRQMIARHVRIYQQLISSRQQSASGHELGRVPNSRGVR